MIETKNFFARRPREDQLYLFNFLQERSNSAYAAIFRLREIHKLISDAVGDDLPLDTSDIIVDSITNIGEFKVVVYSQYEELQKVLEYYGKKQHSIPLDQIGSIKDKLRFECDLFTSSRQAFLNDKRIHCGG